MKVISVVPSEEVSDKVDQLIRQLRTSRAGFCLFALDFVLPKLESGEMQLVNGRLQFTGTRPAPAPENYSA